jgi:flagellar hook-length control protein FliK
MSVHPSPRLPAAAGDAAPASGADTAAGGGDLFNILVSGLVGTGATASATGDDDASPAVAEATEIPPEAGKEVPESVEQLLALVGASRTHGTGKKAGASTDDEAKLEDSAPDATAGNQDPAAPAAAPPVAIVAQSAPIAPAIIAAAAPAEAALAAVPTAASALATPTAPPAANAETALTADPSLPDAGLSPPPTQAEANQPQPAGDALQQPATAAPAQAAIRTLLAELNEPAGERRRPERTLPVEVATIAAAAPRQAELPPALDPAPAPLAPAQPRDATPVAAPASPLQGLMMERQLDLAHQQNWIDQLARDISSAAGGEGGSLRFRLNPEHLGTLHVEIAQTHQGAAVRFSADSEAARSIIADAQPRLVAEARAQGVRISEAHVDLGAGGGSGDPRRQAAAPADVPIRTARSLQEDPARPAHDGKPTPRPRELYA